MRLVRTLVVTSLVAVVLALAAAPAGAQSTPTLIDVRDGTHTGYDRVVFEFRGAVPEHRVGYVDQLVEDGTGDPVSVAGDADLEVVFQGANAHEENGSPTITPRPLVPRYTRPNTRGSPVRSLMPPNWWRSSLIRRHVLPASSLRQISSTPPTCPHR